jgi:hypothetical protein
MNQPVATAIPMDRWSKDHWSLLLYIEDLCVNGKDGVGTIRRNRMRANEVTHPLLAHGLTWKPSNGTRLKGYFQLENRYDTAVAEAQGVQVLAHDDWDCLDDLDEAGLVEILSLANGYVRMTPAGLDLTAELRAHAAGGGQCATFIPQALAQAA